MRTATHGRDMGLPLPGSEFEFFEPGGRGASHAPAWPLRPPVRAAHVKMTLMKLALACAAVAGWAVLLAVVVTITV
jgi:hypothetical protein